MGGGSPIPADWTMQQPLIPSSLQTTDLFSQFSTRMSDLRNSSKSGARVLCFIGSWYLRFLENLLNRIKFAIFILSTSRFDVDSTPYCNFLIRPTASLIDSLFETHWVVKSCYCFTPGRIKALRFWEGMQKYDLLHLLTLILYLEGIGECDICYID